MDSEVNAGWIASDSSAAARAQQAKLVELVQPLNVHCCDQIRRHTIAARCSLRLCYCCLVQVEEDKMFAPRRFFFYFLLFHQTFPLHSAFCIIDALLPCWFMWGTLIQFTKRMSVGICSQLPETGMYIYIRNYKYCVNVPIFLDTFGRSIRTQVWKDGCVSSCIMDFIKKNVWWLSAGEMSTPQKSCA